MAVRKLELEIERIKERNRRVESDKAWETSLTRKLIIIVATYFIIALFLLVSSLESMVLSSYPDNSIRLVDYDVTHFQKILAETHF